jgi:hypothetical protein
MRMNFYGPVEVWTEFMAALASLMGSLHGYFD